MHRPNVKDSRTKINELLNKRSKSCNIDFLKDSDKQIRQRKNMSNLINENFCSIGENLASKIADAPNSLLAGDSVVNNKNSRFKFKHTSTWTSGMQLPNSKLIRFLEMTPFQAIS